VIEFIRSQPDERHPLDSLKPAMRMISPSNAKFSNYIRSICGLIIEDGYVVYRPEIVSHQISIGAPLPAAKKEEEKNVSPGTGTAESNGGGETVYIRPDIPRNYTISEIMDFINNQPGGNTEIGKVKSMLNVKHAGFSKFKDYIRSFPQLEIYDEHTNSLRVRVRKKKRWRKKIPDHFSHSDVVDIVLNQKNQEMSLKDLCSIFGVNIYFPSLIAELEKIELLEIWERKSGSHIVRYAPQKSLVEFIQNQPGKECVLALIEIKRPSGVKLKPWIESMPEFEVFQKGLVHWVRLRRPLAPGSRNLREVAAASQSLRDSEGAPTYAAMSQRGTRIVGVRGRGLRGRGDRNQPIKSRGRGILPPNRKRGVVGERDHNRFGLLTSESAIAHDW